MNILKESRHPLSSQTPDSELIALAIQGDGAAFELIMRRHNQLLFRTARSILKHNSEAEDAVQEAYLNAWRALKYFRAESKLSTWLVRIVTREALKRVPQRNNNVIPLEEAMASTDQDTQYRLTEAPSKAPEQALQRQQVRQLLEDRIDLLPEAYRIVFMLRAVEDMDINDIANILDIPEATVRTRFFRAKGLLRESLASEIDQMTGSVFSFDGERCDRIVKNTLERAKQEGLLISD